MKYTSILLASLLATEPVLAGFSSLPFNHPSASDSSEFSDSIVRTNTGFIVNKETHEVYCKFNRFESPNSFPEFTEAFREDSRTNEIHKDDYSSIPDCDQAQIEVAESFAQQSANQEIKVAALPAVVGAAICTVAFIDGAVAAYTFGKEKSHSSQSINMMGQESMAYAGWQILKGGSDSAIGLGIRAIIKLNFLCTGAGAAAGAATRGIVYLKNR